MKQNGVTTGSDVSPRLDEQVCFMLYRASRAMIRAYTPLLEPLGLTYPQYLVMLVLWESDRLSVKQLGERLKLDSATLTPLLKRLEQRGLVKRQRDNHDQRVVHLTCTDDGYALQSQTALVPASLACRLKGGGPLASKTNRERFMAVLNDLACLLEVEQDSAK